MAKGPKKKPVPKKEMYARAIRLLRRARRTLEKVLREEEREKALLDPIIRGD